MASANRTRVLELVLVPKMDTAAAANSTKALGDVEKQSKAAESAVASLAKAFGYGGLAEKAGHAQKAAAGLSSSLSDVALVTGGAVVAVGLLVAGAAYLTTGLLDLGRAASKAEAAMKTALDPAIAERVDKITVAIAGLDDATNRLTVSAGSSLSDPIATLGDAFAGLTLQASAALDAVSAFEAKAAGGLGVSQKTLEKGTARALFGVFGAGAGAAAAGAIDTGAANAQAVAAAKAAAEFGKATAQVGKDAAQATKALEANAKAFTAYGPDVITPEARAAYQAKQAAAYWDSIFSVYNDAAAKAAMEQVKTAKQISDQMVSDTEAIWTRAQSAFSGAAQTVMAGSKVPTYFDSSAGAIPVPASSSGTTVAGVATVASGISSGTLGGATAGIMSAAGASNPWVALIQVIIENIGKGHSILNSIAKQLDEFPEKIMSDTDKIIAKSIPKLTTSLTEMIPKIIPAIVGGIAAGFLDLIGQHKAADRILHPNGRYAADEHRGAQKRADEFAFAMMNQAKGGEAFAIGGRIPSTGFHWLEEGEEVVGRDGTASGAARSRMGGGSSGVTVIVQGPVYGVPPDEFVQNLGRRLDLVRSTRGLGKV